jgi:hypothetical protein
VAKLFISYGRKSQAQAGQLADDLEALGHEVWFDKQLSGGQAWWDQILGVIRGCEAFIFLLDPEGLNSIACQREFTYAGALGKFILPVLVADGVSIGLLPPELSAVQFIDYRKQDRASALALARALANMPSAKPLPDPLPTPPEVPLSYLGTLTRKVDFQGALSYEEQSALVVDLRRSLREDGSAADARSLLLKLRRRRDLYAGIAEEIDELVKPAPARVEPAPVPAQAPPVPAPVRPAPPLVSEPVLPIIRRPAEPPPTTSAPSWNNRLRGALAGFVVGAVLGLASSATLNRVESAALVMLAVITGVSFAIAGAIVGNRTKLFVVTAAGVLLGFALAHTSFGISASERFAVSVMIGGGSGAIVGALAGLVINEFVGWYR